MHTLRPHIDHCGRTGRRNVAVANCKMTCACFCHRPLYHFAYRVANGFLTVDLKAAAARALADDYAGPGRSRAIR
jgi:hypothetical protein